MNKDFILITGHGIFPTSSILQIVPVTDVSFEVNVVAPSEIDGKFIFSIIKQVSVNLDIARANPTKKNDTEVITDYGYSEIISEAYDFSQDELLSMLELSDDDSIKGYIKDFNRRFKKYIDYQTAIAAIESNPELPDYAASLAAVKQNAPGDSYFRKQEKTQNKIRDYVMEKFLSVVESADDDDDYVGKKLMDIINSEDSQDSMEHAATKVLRKFYNKNLDELSDLNFGEEPSDLDFDEDVPDTVREEDFDRMANEAVAHAETIRNNPNTLSNNMTMSLDNDDEDAAETNDETNSVLR